MWQRLGEYSDGDSVPWKEKQGWASKEVLTRASRHLGPESAWDKGNSKKSRIFTMNCNESNNLRWISKKSRIFMMGYNESNNMWRTYKKLRIFMMGCDESNNLQWTYKKSRTFMMDYNESNNLLWTYKKSRIFMIGHDESNNLQRTCLIMMTIAGQFSKKKKKKVKP